MQRLQLGDVVRLKKRHPCGDDRWEILRTGADFRIRCLGCGRLLMVPRARLERSIRQILPPATPDQPAGPADA